MTFSRTCLEIWEHFHQASWHYLFSFYFLYCKELIRYFQKALTPNLPEDLAISFYIQSHKLIFVAYQLSSVHGTMRIDSCQADCAVPWLSDVLFMLTAALHMCQQLKDKVSFWTTVQMIDVYAVLSLLKQSVTPLQLHSVFALSRPSCILLRHYGVCTRNSILYCTGVQLFKSEWVFWIK